MTPEEVSLIEEVITEDDIIRFKTEAPKQRRYPHCTVSITKMTSTEKKKDFRAGVKPATQLAELKLEQC
jgi:hypothetical protein